MRSEDEHRPNDPRDLDRRAFAFVLAKLSRRDQAEQELKTALTRKGFSEETTAAALDRARAAGLVCDERLAGTFAQNSVLAGKRGRRLVVASLLQKGISAEAAESAVTAAFAEGDDGEARLVRLATRLLERSRGKTVNEKRPRVMRSLLARGFEFDEARNALRLAENAMMTENSGHDADADQ